jgi:hypothetical protein
MHLLFGDVTSFRLCGVRDVFAEDPILLHQVREFSLNGDSGRRTNMLGIAVRRVAKDVDLTPFRMFRSRFRGGESLTLGRFVAHCVAGCPKNVFSTCVDVVLLSLESSGFRGKRGSVRFVGILYELRTRGYAVVSVLKHQQLSLR